MNRSKATHRSNKGILFVITAAILVFLLGFFLGSRNINEVEAKDYTADTVKYYTSVEIEDGDTLWEIADEYMSQEFEDKEAFIDEVCEMNHITGSMIRSGSTILVPYYR